MNPTTDFRSLAERIVDDLLEADPVAATSLGDHRFDGRLTGVSAPAARRDRLDDHVAMLDAIDDIELGVADFVDLEILRARVLRDRFMLAELRPHEWNPMWWNPGTGLYLLVSRDFAPADERAVAMRGRLAAIPDHLEQARAILQEMPRIHVETAIQQFHGTGSLIRGDAARLAGDDAVVHAATVAVERFEEWLSAQLPESQRDPRLGPDLYAAALWHALDEDTAADALLADALEQLDRVGTELRDLAAAYLGLTEADDAVVRVALNEVASSAPVTDATVLPLMEAALARTTAFVRREDLVTVPDLDVRMVEMPEIHRGTAVAYCDAPGPLEEADVATYVAVAPTPVGWDADRVASFYREYNGIALHGLVAHEAMPGHVLQLAHARTLESETRVRRLGRSGVLVEGWAVYAEQMMVDAGYQPLDDPRSALAVTLQQRKMLLRGIINTILDISVHAHGMQEAEAMSLMVDRGFQEVGEAAGKWRRALLTAAQLPTYHVGFRAVETIAADLRVLHPDWSPRQVHDLMLAFGSPAPRHLRTLLGI
ncbi:MAG: DUF885 domain-containing protein [Actinomycetota bacterium]|nr:DUF885 domain-containing protein [Actinomycetota bacterium]